MKLRDMSGMTQQFQARVTGGMLESLIRTKDAQGELFGVKKMDRTSGTLSLSCSVGRPVDS